MNRKVLVSIIFAAVLVISAVGYIVISNAVNAFKPVALNISAAQRATVSGNGGNAVIVGDYVYFIGNYVETSSIKYKQNEYNKVEYGAIYRAKLDNGVPTYSDAARADEIDYVTHLTDNLQLIVPKIAGFEKSALYVFDKYLIYTSPNNTKDKYGSLQTAKIDFFRVDLTGANHRHIYTTGSDAVALTDFTVACYGKDIYLLIEDGGNLRRVNVTGSIGNVSLISGAATGFALPALSAYSAGDGSGNSQGRSLADSYSGVMSFVYYTEALSAEDTQSGAQGNVLKQYRVSDGTNKVLAKLPYVEFGVKGLGNGRLLYTVNENVLVSTGLQPSLYMTKETTAEPFVESKRGSYLVLDGSGIQSEESFSLPLEFDPSNDDCIFVSTASSSLFLYRKENGASVTSYKKIEDCASIVAVTTSTVYYKNASGSVMFVSLYGNGAAEQTGFDGSASLCRLSLFSQSGTDRIFYIKTFTEGENSTNSAMMRDVRAGKDYILGCIADKYLPENLKDKE